MAITIHKTFWINNKQKRINITNKNDNLFCIEIDHKKTEVILVKQEKSVIFIEINKTSYKAKILENNNDHIKVYIFNFDKTFTINYKDRQ